MVTGVTMALVLAGLLSFSFLFIPSETARTSNCEPYEAWRTRREGGALVCAYVYKQDNCVSDRGRDSFVLRVGDEAKRPHPGNHWVDPKGSGYRGGFHDGPAEMRMGMVRPGCKLHLYEGNDWSGWRGYADTPFFDNAGSKYIRAQSLWCECGNLPEDVLTCKIRDEWDEVITCRRLSVCKFAMSVGVSRSTSASRSGSTTHTVEGGMKATILSVFDLHVQYSFASTSGWSETVTRAVSVGKTDWPEVQMAPGEEITILQRVKVCGSYRVNLPDYKKVNARRRRRRWTPKRHNIHNITEIACVENDRHSMSDNDGGYYLCLGGRYEVVSCMPNYVFDANKGQCTLNEKAVYGEEY